MRDKSHELSVYAFTYDSILLNVFIAMTVRSMPADMKSITENAWIQFFILFPIIMYVKRESSARTNAPPNRDGS